MKKITIDGWLIVCFLVLTVWHNSHILAKFETIKELAWFLAIGIDVGLARAAWVSTTKQIGAGARGTAAVWMCFLLLVSYGINTAFYLESGAGEWAWGLAAIFPLSMLFLGIIVSGVSSSRSSSLEAEAAHASTRTELEATRDQLTYTQDQIHKEQATRTELGQELTDALARADQAEAAQSKATQEAQRMRAERDDARMHASSHASHADTVDYARIAELLRAHKAGPARGGLTLENALTQLRATIENQHATLTEERNAHAR